ncbi:hypothetical protein ACLB2K_028377 [Fragaria x ananassa]
MYKYEEYLDYDDEPQGSFPINCRRPNAHGGLHRPNNSTLQPLSNRYQKFSARIRVSPLEEWEGKLDIGMCNNVTTSIRGFIRETAIGRTKTTDRADRATVEKVLDFKTIFIIHKMMHRHVYEVIHGCISTGKEAHVYHAINSDGKELAIKVFKTSVLDFKDRAKYVQGDFRFRRVFRTKNPRKMMKILAEKEMRNLMRIKDAGIRCPTVRDIKHHVLVMDFIGKGGWAAPLLNDAALSLDKLREGYREIIIAMRMLYQKAKLVHTDLSEFNILYFEGHLYIIDVSQAVELFDDNANDFLRQDCLHVSGFFKKRGVAVMTVRELFDFIVDPSIAEEAVDSYLDEVQKKIVNRGDISVVDEIAESVFLQAYIPSTLNQVMDVEADVLRLTSGEDTEDMYYKTITGLRQALSCVPPSQPESESDYADDEDVSIDSQSSSGIKAKEPLDKKVARKENKKKVKEEKKEARKHKLPKAVKKRRKKLSQGGNRR